MEIIVGKTAGFCYGVKRAVEESKKQAEKSKGKIYCLGEIVHNKDVVKELEKKGIKFIDNIEEAEDNLIIRAHGITKEIYKQAKEKNLNILDYTCPNVLKIHNIANEYSKEYHIILFGNINHPENIGTLSYCAKNYSVIENKEDIEKVLEKIKKEKKEKVLIISQTTYSIKKFEEYTKIIKKELEKENIEVIIKNTICKATEIRQKETKEISKKVDSMIIIGGKNSSNTKKLFEIAKENCINSYLVENADELDFNDFQEKSRIGIMAGASTPKEKIEEIVMRLSK